MRGVSVWFYSWPCFRGVPSWGGDGPKPHSQGAPRPAPNPLRNAYFGDLHVHTSYSLDAYAMGNRNDPRVAYRFGRGETISLAGRVRKAISKRLSILWPSRTMTYGWANCRYARTRNDPPTKLRRARLCVPSTQDPEKGLRGMWGMAAQMLKHPAGRSAEVCGSAEADENNKCFQRAQSIWQQIQKNADEFYEPGKFTTFAGYEWSAGFKRVGMLHRNVIFRGGQVPQAVYSAVDLNNSPERLWKWLEQACTGECQVISIPHNTNFGWGIALASNNSDGTPFTTEGLTRRAKTEPVIELFQSKGNSECSPGLGTNDEQCNFEQLFKPCKPGEEAFCAVASNYVRNALKTGLVLEDQYGVNPFKYGFIGSTDTHSSAAGATEEGNWPGTGSLGDNRPETRLNHSVGPEFPVKSVLNNPGGLAGVWAEENTRESIFDALKRRESFATSGTRIRVRFFGGWNYPSDLHRSRDVVEAAYRSGVPMGGDLPAKPNQAKVPRFRRLGHKRSQQRQPAERSKSSRDGQKAGRPTKRYTTLSVPMV